MDCLKENELLCCILCDERFVGDRCAVFWQGSFVPISKGFFIKGLINGTRPGKLFVRLANKEDGKFENYRSEIGRFLFWREPGGADGVRAFG